MLTRQYDDPADPANDAPLDGQGEFGFEAMFRSLGEPVPRAGQSRSFRQSLAANTTATTSLLGRVLDQISQKTLQLRRGLVAIALDDMSLLAACKRVQSARECLAPI